MLIDEGTSTVMFFVVSVGRCGSKSVASAYGFEHEPDGSNPQLANVIRRAKDRLIYGEASPFWRLKLDELMAAFPGAHYFHLVRDGRLVVKSYQARGVYEDFPGDPPYRNMPIPVPDFDLMTRFEKICHHWKYWNEKIQQKIKNRIRLEDIAGLPRLNASSKALVPWTLPERRLFKKICGDLNQSYGYGGAL